MQPGSLYSPVDLPDHSFSDGHPLAGTEAAVQALRACGALFWARGWSVGTSSNYSIRLQSNPLELLVTASGKDKGHLTHDDFVRVDQLGKPVVPDQPKSSAETLLHVVLAEQPDVGAVLHTHSVWATVLSDLYGDEGVITISGYEMLKGLAGVATHEHSARIAIFDNTQKIPLLAEQLRVRLEAADDDVRHAFLIRRHGLYTWGRDCEEARRHVEVVEFLLECVARRLVFTGELVAQSTC